jgi:hypothetical protein
MEVSSDCSHVCLLNSIGDMLFQRTTTHYIAESRTIRETSTSWRQIFVFQALLKATFCCVKIEVLKEAIMQITVFLCVITMSAGSYVYLQYYTACKRAVMYTLSLDSCVVSTEWIDSDTDCVTLCVSSTDYYWRYSISVLSHCLVSSLGLPLSARYRIFSRVAFATWQ